MRDRIAGVRAAGRGVWRTVGNGDGEPFNPTGVGGGVDAPAVAATAATRTATAVRPATTAGRPARARRRTGPRPTRRLLRLQARTEVRPQEGLLELAGDGRQLAQALGRRALRVGVPLAQHRHHDSLEERRLALGEMSVHGEVTRL